MHTRASLTADFRRLGLAAGDTVMLHASVRAVGPVVAGPDQILAALETAIAPGGTVLMYLGCNQGYDDVGRGALSAADEAAWLDHAPAFDFDLARANKDHGFMAEVLRTTPGSVMSHNVGARMGARGARARDLTERHPWHDGYGPGSPLERLVQAGGKVVLLGSDPDAVTLLHYAEAIAPIEGKRRLRYRTPVKGPDGATVWRPVEEYDTSGALLPAWPPDLFARIVHAFLAQGGGETGQVGDATTHLLPAKPLVDFAVPFMVRVAGGERP